MTIRKFLAYSMLASTPAAVQFNQGPPLPQRHMVIVNDTKSDVAIRVVSGTVVGKGIARRIQLDTSSLSWTVPYGVYGARSFTLEGNKAVHATFGFTQDRGLIITVNAGSEKAITYHAYPNDKSQQQVLLKLVKSDDPLRVMRSSAKQSYVQVGEKVISLEDNIHRNFVKRPRNFVKM